MSPQERDDEELRRFNALSPQQQDDVLAQMESKQERNRTQAAARATKRGERERQEQLAELQKHSTGSQLPLLPHHLKELYESTLNDDMISAQRIYTEHDGNKLDAMIGRRYYVGKWGAAIVFPYLAADGTVLAYRIKPDRSPNKYIWRNGQDPLPYIPLAVWPKLQDPTEHLLIVEGEKKTLAAVQLGYVCIGLGGVWAYSKKNFAGLLRTLERSIAWKDRCVTIIFDSDVATKEGVRDALCRLAAELRVRGAHVDAVTLAAGANGEKVGLDDYLLPCVDRAAELKALIEKAEPVEAPDPADEKCAAAELDPASTMRAFIATLQVDQLPTTRYWHSTFWRWRNGAFREVEQSAVDAQVMHWLNDRAHHVSASIHNNHLKQLKALVQLSNDIEAPTWLPPLDYDGDLSQVVQEPPPREVIAARNGLLHVPTRQLIPPTPWFFTLAAVDYDIDLSAPSPALWLRTLGEIFPQDQQSIDTLQEWFGLCLVADTSFQKIAMLIGPPRSGKSVLTRILTALVGAKNVIGPSLSTLGGEFGLQSFLGKSLAIIPDARLPSQSDQATAVSRILAISGEDSVEINRKHKTSIDCKLTTRLMVVSNELPRLIDAANALAARLIVFRFHVSFLGKENTQLTEQLKTELPGILLWTIEGWQRLNARGYFVQPTTGAELVEDLRDLSSPMRTFVDECCVVEATGQVMCDDLRTIYCAWCDNYKMRPQDWRIVTRDLRALVPTISDYRPIEDKSRVRYYKGIGLNLTYKTMVQILRATRHLPTTTAHARR